MRIHAPLIIAVFAAGAASTSCGLFYSGDGHVIDLGWGNAPLYKIDLGPVDLTHVGTYTYRLVGLPDKELTVGFEIIEAQPNDSDARPSHPSVVRLELKASDDRTVISEYGPLDAWVWSHSQNDPVSFLYRNGEERDIRLEGGSIRIEKLGVKADGGWGTYFSPMRMTSYTLTLNVVEAQHLPQRPTRLQLHGRSWK
jgi:hypothetical protein